MNNRNIVGIAKTNQTVLFSYFNPLNKNESIINHIHVFE